jgi:hypothetical protein
MVARNKICHVFSKLKHYLVTLNVFPSVPPSTDEYELRTQRISTRSFIFLWIVLMVILLLYTSLIRVTKTVKVEVPSYVQYSHLHSSYSQTILCPCSRISIDYDKFLHVEYALHQVCSNIFVDQSWIDYLAKLKETRTFMIDDFRHISSSAFQGVRTFCKLINHTISDSLTRLYSNQYVSGSVKPAGLFQSETKALLNQFRSSMINSFLSSLSMVRDTTHVNGLLSALKTTHTLWVNNSSDLVFISPKTYQHCNCASSSTCIQASSIFDYPYPISSFDVPGFYTGCYVIESLLQSTLECFYSQQCIDQLKLDIS